MSQMMQHYIPSFSHTGNIYGINDMSISETMNAGTYWAAVATNDDNDDSYVIAAVLLLLMVKGCKTFSFILKHCKWNKEEKTTFKSKQTHLN